MQTGNVWVIHPESDPEPSAIRGANLKERKMLKDILASKNRKN